ncbi:hypothetical protein Clacol_007014 [Clathrus columnatus]|uniref:Uncharacterized protein n=1 Tax=Clathrus columnatus TaxID=1419009 RepID=A0AAV5AI09_9AGAM|nr:hypothetical protein Clacol_007014 [Clathrus columnatus]
MPPSHFHIEVLASTPPALVSPPPNSKTHLWFNTSRFRDLSRYCAFQIETQSTHAVTAEEAICWFEIVLANEKGLQSLRGGKRITWFSHANDTFLSGSGTKQYGMVFNSQHELFKRFQASSKPGDVIGVQITAPFAGWHLRSIQGRLTAKPVPNPSRALPWNPWSLDFVPEGGIYTIASLSEGIFRGVDDNVNKQIWFTTQPFDLRTVQRLEGAQLFTTAKYETEGEKAQYEESPCSFEIVVLDSSTATEPKAEGVRESHVINADAHDFIDSKGPYLVKGFGALSTLAAGGAIGVRLCAPKGTTNHARHGPLTPTIETIVEAPSECIDNNGDTMIWFKTPPLMNPFDHAAFQFVTYAQNPTNRKESRCRFYLVILKNDGSSEVVLRDNKELAWLSHAFEEVPQCQFGLKQFGAVFDHQHELFSYLQARFPLAGDIIAMQIRSTAQTWHIRSIEGKLLGKIRTGGEDYSSDLLPSWNMESILEDGLYTVIHTAPKAIRADEHQDVRSLWFKSPALDRKIIYHVESFRLHVNAFEKEVVPGNFSRADPGAAITLRRELNPSFDFHSNLSSPSQLIRHQSGSLWRGSNTPMGYNVLSSPHQVFSGHMTIGHMEGFSPNIRSPQSMHGQNFYFEESYTEERTSSFTESSNVQSPAIEPGSDTASNEGKNSCSIQLMLLESPEAADSELAWTSQVLKEEPAEGDKIFDIDSEMISSMKPGNLIGVQLSALNGRAVYASDGRLVMRIQGLCCSTAEKVSTNSKARPPSSRPQLDLIPTLKADSGSSHVLAAILTPDIPDAPEIYSKYIIQALYRSNPDMPAQTIALLVNTDVAVPRFKSKGATALYALRVEFERASDVTGFTEFWGSIGKGEIHLTTRQKVIVHGPIEGGPVESLAFVGGGTWLMS